MTTTANSPTALLEASHIGFRTPDGKTIFDGLDFKMNAGQLLLITGPNGAGKSTLIKILLRKLAPSTGLVRTTVSAKKVAYIPQLQNMEFHLPLRLREVIEISHRSPMDANQICDIGLLDMEQLKLTWNTASGGERQRTLLSCALLEKPELLVLDEPLNHLDKRSTQQMLKVLAQFLGVRDQARGVVLVSHAAVHELTTLGADVVHVDLLERQVKDHPC